MYCGVWVIIQPWIQILIHVSICTAGAGAAVRLLVVEPGTHNVILAVCGEEERGDGERDEMRG